MTIVVLVSVILLVQLRIWWLTQDSHWKVQCALEYLHRIDQRLMK